MAEKILNTRILMKVDTLENWNKSTLKLKKGELAFATVAASAGTGLEEPVVMVKIGTAEEKTFSELPWAFHAKASDVLAACKSEAGLTQFVKDVLTAEGVASDSVVSALTKRVTDAEGKITTLEGTVGDAEKGLVKGVADNAAAIDALEDLVGDKKVAVQISEAIAALKLEETYAAKALEGTVDTHVKDTVAHVTAQERIDWNNALQAADVVTGSANGTISVKGSDVAVKGLGSAAYTDASAYDVSGAAAQALVDAKAYADGLAGNYDAAGSASAAETAAKKYAKEYADGLAGNYDAAGSAAGALEDAKEYTDGRISAMVGDKSVQAQIADLKLAETYDAKGAAAQALIDAKAYADAEDAKIESRVEALEAIDHEHANKAVLDGITAENVAAWDAAEGNAKGYADDLDEAMDVRVKALEGKFGEGEGNVESQIAAAVAAEAKLRDDADKELAADIKAIADDYLKAADKTALQEQITANDGEIAALQGLVGDKKVSEAISEAVQAEETRAKGEEARIEGLVATEKARAEGVEAGLDERLVEVEAFFKLAEGETLDTALDTLVEIQEYLDGEGAVADQMLLDIAANKKAIEDHAALDHDFAAADATLKSELNGEIAKKVAQTDFDDLEERVEVAEGAIGDVEDRATVLEGRMTTAEADIDALEAKVGDKTVEAAIKDAIDALQIGDYAKAADLTAAVNRIATAEGKITTLEGEMDAVEGRATALETEIAKKANDADLAAIAKTGNVNDLVQTEGDVLIFDCGDAGVTA